VSGKIVTEKIMMTTCSLQKLVKLIVSQCCSRPSNKKKERRRCVSITLLVVLFFWEYWYTAHDQDLVFLSTNIYFACYEHSVSS
jgi:hypothetical protein